MATPKRRTYSLKEKAEALSQIEEENLTFSEMERKSTIPRKCLSDWAKKSPQILKQAGIKSSRLRGCERKALFPD